MSAVEGSGREGGVEGHALGETSTDHGDAASCLVVASRRTVAGIKPGPSLSEPSIDARRPLTECTSDEPLVEERPFRECRHCGEDILLNAQPDDDDRAFCSEDCFLSDGGAL